MAKTITIRDDVFMKLLTIKDKDESFSELFDRLIEYATPAETLKKLRGSAEFTDKEAILSELYSKRAIYC